MKLQYKKYNNRLYHLDVESEHMKSTYSINELIPLYKKNEGNLIIINDEEMEITKSFLLKVVCNSVQSEEDYWNYFSKLVEDEDLESMIYSNSFNNWFQRGLRR